MLTLETVQKYAAARIFCLETELSVLFDKVAKETAKAVLEPKTEQEAVKTSAAELDFTTDSFNVINSVIRSAEDVALPIDRPATNIVVPNVKRKNPGIKAKAKKTKKHKDYNSIANSWVQINEADVIDESIITFSVTKPMPMNQFFKEFDFESYLEEGKYYSFNALKDMYQAYSGINSKYTSMSSLFRDYSVFEGVSFTRCHNSFVFNLNALKTIQANLNAQAEPLQEEIKKPAPIPSIHDYLLNVIDVKTVEASDMTFSNIAEDYESRYNIKVLPKLIREEFQRANVNAQSFVGKSGTVRGSVLAKMILRLRENTSAAPQEKETVIPVNNIDTSEKPLQSTIADRIGYSIR